MKGKKYIFWMILAFVLLAFLEVFSLVSSMILKRAMPPLIWQPVEFTDVALIEDYLATRDKRLGWPSASQRASTEFDDRGSRVNIHFPATDPVCVSTYGDSFTWSDEVGAKDSWQNTLSSHQDCRVENFGINGYGVGQAVLRHQENMIDVAPIVILTIVPYNIYRNLNQMRTLIQGGNDPLSLKPRFYLDEGELKLEPLPTLKPSEIAGLAAEPWTLEQELFLPGTSYGPIEAGFPYSKLWLDLAFSGQFRDRLSTATSGTPHWQGFYTYGHETGALELTIEIVRRFADNAKARGQTPIVLLLPDSRSIQYHLDGNGWEYQLLIDAVEDMGVEVTNTGPHFLSSLDGDSFCSLLTNPGGCGGHFNPDGYALFGSIVHEILQARLASL